MTSHAILLFQTTKAGSLQGPCPQLPTVTASRFFPSKLAAFDKVRHHRQAFLLLLSRPIRLLDLMRKDL